MKIFYLCGDPGIAPDGTKGASVHLRSLAAALSRAQHEVVLLTYRAPAIDGAGAAAASGGVSVPAGLLASGGLRAPCLPLAGVASVVRAAEVHGLPDLVLERYAMGHEDGIHAARSLRRPFVLEVNAPLVDEAATYRGVSRGTPTHDAAASIERRLLAQADVVACVSRPLEAWVRRERPQERTTILVRNGFDPALVVPAQREARREARREAQREARHAARNGDVRIAFLGHPKPWHGADRLAGILARLRAREIAATLEIIGGGPGAEAVARAASQAGVAEHVHVTGPLAQAEALAYLASCDVSIAPYPPIEPFYFCPIKIIESMAAGVPVVASAQGDVAEILGGTGITVPAASDAAFVDAVAGLAHDSAKLDALARDARRRAHEHFTWDATAAALLAGAPAVTSARSAQEPVG